MMKAAQVARERGIPYFGICYGFQWADRRVRAERRRAARRRFDRVRAGHADQGDLQAARSARRRRSRRHDAPRRLPVRAGTGLARPARLRREHRFTNGTATATSSTACTSARSTEHGLRISGRSPDGKFVEIAETARSIPGTWRCSSIRSSSRSRPGRIRCLPRSSKPATSTRPTSPAPPPRRSAWSCAPNVWPEARGHATHIMSSVTPVQLGDLTFGGERPFVLIAGPCVIESEAHATTLAGRLRDITATRFTPFVFKASYDKANRTSGRSFRGPGLAEGLRILAAIKATVARADPHRHPRTGARRPGGRGRRHPADPGVPLPADGSARRRGARPAAS